MQCPIDGTELLITHRQNIEIDYCPKCRGIWLDRGELDKIIERSTQEIQPQQSSKQVTSDQYDDDYYDNDQRPRYSDDKSYQDKKRHKPRRISFLEDLLDF